LIKTLIKKLQSESESIPAFKLNLQPELPIFRIGHDLLNMALENIIRNAIEATDSNGEIIISSLLEDKFDPDKKSLNQWINIEIIDNGTGISEDDLKNIFTIGASIKPGGSGVGLSITKEILTHFGGEIEINSQLNLGTTVNIYLPTK